MKTITVVAKCKGQDLPAQEMDMPENINEAIEMVGAERVLALFCQQFKIQKLNSMRAAAQTGSAIPKILRTRIMALSPDKRETVAAALGIDIDELLKDI